ncbi:malonate transporter, L subunit [Burkholderia thailandensis E264]|uniref:Malonate transporter, L subunit n=2 Tax=Burkholderia thailandensis TaxID=57975 RepID=Q2SUT2_BURTA|nr:malonate transporter, L subunit [Burkholderia thailandensis E264]
MCEARAARAARLAGRAPAAPRRRQSTASRRGGLSGFHAIAGVLPLPPENALRTTSRRAAALAPRRSVIRTQETSMIIYGTALLAFCHLAGLFLGDLLGAAIGAKTNVGGVGIAMLLLIGLRLALHRRGWLPKETESGIAFWGAMYIPVVVAMAANQNVVAALKGGPVALLSAVGAVAVCAACIAVLARVGRDATTLAALPQPEEN